jgi:hypothetical protein
VYRFVGDMFDPNTPISVETHLQKLKELDDITVKTVSSSVLNPFLASCVSHAFLPCCEVKPKPSPADLAGAEKPREQPVSASVRACGKIISTV